MSLCAMLLVIEYKQKGFNHIIQPIFQIFKGRIHVFLRKLLVLYLR